MRVYHDTIITCSIADSFCSLFPYPHNPRSHTCAYVTDMKDNVSRSFEIRQVIHDDSGVTSRNVRCLCGDVWCLAVTKVIRNNLDLRHIHVKICHHPLTLLHHMAYYQIHRQVHFYCETTAEYKSFRCFSPQEIVSDPVKVFTLRKFSIFTCESVTVFAFSRYQY
jgi:hypothetical protein